VDNVAPAAPSITKPQQIKEDQSANFTTTASDAGINGALTYT
jgi:hypothetical protein